MGKALPFVGQAGTLGPQVTGILVFKEEAGCAEALAAAAGGALLELAPSEPEAPVGLRAWVAAHKASFPGNQA